VEKQVQKTIGFRGLSASKKVDLQAREKGPDRLSPCPSAQTLSKRRALKNGRKHNTTGNAG
jgi:hypothetical protein